MEHGLDKHYRPFVNSETGETAELAPDRRRAAALIGAVVDNCAPCMEEGYEWVSSPEGMVVLDRLTNWIITRSEDGLWTEELETFTNMTTARRRAMAEERVGAMAYRLSGGAPIPMVAQGAPPTRPFRVPRPGQRTRKKRKK